MSNPSIIEDPRDLLQERLEQHLTLHHDGDPDLWLVQNEAISGTYQTMVAKPHSRAYGYDMFTATGKTRLYIKIMELMASNKVPPKTIIAVPTRALIHKAFEEIEKFAPWIIKSHYVGSYYAGRKVLGRPITVTTHMSLVKGTTLGVFDPKTTDLLVLDESHEFRSPIRRKVRDQYKRAVRLELSATSDPSSENRQASHAEIAYSLSPLDAITKKAIAPFRTQLVFTSASLDDVALDALTEDYSEGDLERALNTHARNVTAINFYKIHQDEETGLRLFGQQALVNCMSINHANDFAKLANDKLGKHSAPDVKVCEVIHGGMTGDEQRVILGRFEDGKILMLANVDLLTRGYRDRNNRARISLNLRPSRSAFVVGQRGGRLLGLCADDPDKVAFIYDFVDKVTDPSKYPLLYAEYLNGTRFGTIPKATHKRNTNPTPKVHIGSEHFKDINYQTMTDVEEIMSFINGRKEEVKELLRRGVIGDKVLPQVRERMNELSIPTVVRLWEEVESLLPPVDARHADDFVPTYERFFRIVTGVTSPIHWRRKAFTIEVDALAICFRTYPGKLFPDAHNELMRETVLEDDQLSFDQPYNPKVHRYAQEALERAGYQNFSDLGAHMLGSTKATFISALLRGQRNPIDEKGSWNKTALEIAMLLGEMPEDLYGVDPLQDAVKELGPNISNRTLPVRKDSAGKIVYEGNSLASFMDLEEQRPLSKTMLDENAQDLRKALLDVIDSIGRREQSVIRMRYGIDVYSALSYEEVGEAFGVVRERIRQIEAVALRKLKHPARSDKIRIFWYDEFEGPTSQVPKSKPQKLKKEPEKVDVEYESVLLTSTLRAWNLGDVKYRYPSRERAEGVFSLPVMERSFAATDNLGLSAGIFSLMAQYPEISDDINFPTVQFFAKQFVFQMGSAGALNYLYAFRQAFAQRQNWVQIFDQECVRRSVYVGDIFGSKESVAYNVIENTVCMPIIGLKTPDAAIQEILSDDYPASRKHTHSEALIRLMSHAAKETFGRYDNGVSTRTQQSLDSVRQIKRDHILKNGPQPV